MASEAFIGSVYLPIAARTEITSAEVYAVTRDFLSQGTSANPVLMWESGSMKIVGYISGSLVYAKFTRADGTEGSNSLTATVGYYGVAAWTVQIGSTTYIRVGCCGASSIDGIVSYIRTDSGLVNILYSDTLDNARQNGLIGVSREWDEEPTDDPADPNNDNPSGGGYADTDDFGLTDDLPLADLPDGSDLEVDTGSFLTLYVLDAAEMSVLGTKLFNATFWGALANKFSGLSDPMKFIISANVMPFLVSDGAKEMKLGGVTVETGHSIQYNSKRFIQYTFGALTLKETWGTDKDYSATSVDIYLPYSGVHTLDVDAVMQSTLTLKCNVDLWTGDIVYLLHSSNADMDKKYFKQENVLYRWTGNCATSLPLGTVDPSGPIIKGFSSLAGMAAGFAIGGPAGAAIGGAMASVAGGAAGDGGGAQPQQAGAKQMAGAAVAGLGAASTVLNMDFTPLGGAGNGVSGASGMMDYQFPYLIIKRGVPAYPNNWRAQIGAPRYQTFTLSDLSGYTLFADIKLQNMGVAVQEEIAELERLLTTEGVIL